MDYRESPLLRGNPTQHPLWRAYRGWSDHGHDGATPLDAFVAGVAYGSTEAVTEAPEDMPLRKAPQNGPIGLSVPCPTCGALAGERCIVIGPNSGWRAQPHYTRSADAQGKDLTA